MALKKIYDIGAKVGSTVQKGKRKKREIERQKERDTDTGKERGREIA